MTSTLSGVNALPPLVIVPHQPRRPRGETFRAIVEHEFVHVNQALLGRLLPSRHGTARQRLGHLFFTRFRNEYEAHLLQVMRWPQSFPHGLGLSLEHWCVLRGYTDALESIFVAAWGGEARSRDVLTFLDRLPGRLRRWLRELRVDEDLAPWFRQHLVVHVAVALLSLARTHSGFGKSAVFQAGHRWVAAAASSSRVRRARTAGGTVRGAAVAPLTAVHRSVDRSREWIWRRPRHDGQ
jgi:hypothetical protein